MTLGQENKVGANRQGSKHHGTPPLTFDFHGTHSMTFFSTENFQVPGELMVSSTPRDPSDWGNEENGEERR